jgi:hypothetical protein
MPRSKWWRGFLIRVEATMSVRGDEFVKVKLGGLIIKTTAIPLPDSRLPQRAGRGRDCLIFSRS